MARKERFGRLVLLEEIDSDSLGVFYRAARLGPTGLDRIVTLRRYSREISSDTEASARLMEQARQASRLPVPGLLRVLGIGRVDESYYATFELMDGRTARAVIDRARQSSFPFAADNALMVASRAAAVLEALHARTDDAGAPLVHGLVKPSHLVISWEGDVKLTGLGVWAALRRTGLLTPEDGGYLAPEQLARDEADARSDVFMLAQVLLEILTGRPADGKDALPGLSQARYTTTAGDEAPIPEPILEILRKGLAPEPADRFQEMAAMRKAIDTLLFSGDFTPTTFNLAFFMHSLFREDMERESSALEEASQDDYSEFIAPPEAPPRSPEPAPASAPGKSGVGRASAAAPQPSDELAPGRPVEARPHATPPAPPAAEPAPETLPLNVGPETLPADGSGSGRRRRAPGGRPRAREGSLTFARKVPTRSGGGLALGAGLLLALGVGGGLGYLFYTRQAPSAAVPPTSTLSADAAAAMARVRELEGQLAALEREKAQIEAAHTAADAEAALAKTQAAAEDQAAEEARARAEARRWAQAERDRREREERAQEEIRRIEAQLAEQRLLAQQRATQQALSDADDVPVALPAVATPPPTPVPIPPPVRRGDLVEASDPDVTPPEFISQRPARYPPAARRLRREGSVRVQALVDETGGVTEVKIIESSSPGLGFEDAALQHVRSRRYRPATKNDVPVRMWIPIRVDFTL